MERWRQSGRPSPTDDTELDLEFLSRALRSRVRRAHRELNKSGVAGLKQRVSRGSIAQGNGRTGLRAAVPSSVHRWTRNHRRRTTHQNAPEIPDAADPLYRSGNAVSSETIKLVR